MGNLWCLWNMERNKQFWGSTRKSVCLISLRSNQYQHGNFCCKKAIWYSKIILRLERPELNSGFAIWRVLQNPFISSALKGHISS